MKKQKTEENLNNYKAKKNINTNNILNNKQNLDLYNENVNKINEMNKQFDIMIDKECENMIIKFKKKGEELAKENEKLNLGYKNLEIELKNINNDIEECNKLNKEINDKIAILNNINLNNNLVIECSKDSIKIYLKKSDLKCPEFEEIFKSYEELLITILNDEIKQISKNILNEMNNNVILKKIIRYEEIIEKIINEKNQCFNNCFNQSFSKNNYIYDSDDINKIINYNLKNNNESFYISEIYDQNIFDKAKNALENKKVVFGNLLNQYNIWVSFCIIPKHSPYTFLYKSSNGEDPSYKLKDFIKNITGDYYTEKINKKDININSELSEVNAIENTKIMIQQIQKNKNEFINNFETYNGFFKGDIIQKKELKNNIYPEEYIKSFYNEIKSKLNSSRISIVLFKSFFVDEQNTINIQYLNKIQEILANHEEIYKKEQEILNNEYKTIKNVHEQYKKKEENKLKEEREREKEEKKIFEDILPNDIEQVNNNNNYINTNENNININNKKINDNKSYINKEINNEDYNKKEKINKIEIQNKNNNDFLKLKKNEKKQIIDKDNININKEEIKSNLNIINKRNEENDLLKQQKSNENIKIEDKKLKNETNNNKNLANNMYNSEDQNSSRFIYRKTNQNNNRNMQKGCLERLCDCLKCNY